MANREGTQEFLAAHKDHKTIISMVQTMNTRYTTEIFEYRLPWEEPDAPPRLSAALRDQTGQDWVQDQGAYLYCHDCNVEEEINLGEVIED